MTTTIDPEAELLRRVVDPQRAGWSAEAAQSILTLSFSQADQDRATELAEKAGMGEMTSDEQRDMQGYRRVGHFLELVKSRARLSLNAFEYEKNQFGFLVSKRPPGDTTVTTNEFVNQMRDELGV